MPPSTPPAHCVSCWREEDRGCQEGGFVETSVFGNSDRYSRKRQISFIAKYREKNLDRLKGTRVQLSLLSARGRIGCLVNAEGVSNWEPGGIRLPASEISNSSGSSEQSNKTTAVRACVPSSGYAIGRRAMLSAGCC